MLPLIHVTCDEYLKILWSENAFADIIKDQYFRGGADFPALFQFMRECAKGDDIVLYDMKNWDYETAIYACHL